MTNITTSYAYNSGEGRRLWIVGDTMTFKATAAETGGSLTVVEVLAAPGGGPPPHIHTGEDEMFYVIDGEFEVLHGDQVRRLTTGGFAFVPRGTVHRFENVGDAPARILIAFTPGGFEGFFFAAGIPAVDGEEAPPLDPAEIERSMNAAASYGLELSFPGADHERVNR